MVAKGWRGGTGDWGVVGVDTGGHPSNRPLVDGCTNQGGLWTEQRHGDSPIVAFAARLEWPQKEQPPRSKDRGGCKNQDQEQIRRSVKSEADLQLRAEKPLAA